MTGIRYRRNKLLNKDGDPVRPYIPKMKIKKCLSCEKEELMEDINYICKLCKNSAEWKDAVKEYEVKH